MEDLVLSETASATNVARHPAAPSPREASPRAEGRPDPRPGPEGVAPDGPGPDTLLTLILASLDEDRAEEVVSIDLRGRSEMADHMVIASGRSSRQVSAISEHLTDRLKADTGRSAKVEGADQGDWVLIDAGDVIVHVFRPEVREFYQLEKMWMPTGPDAAPEAGSRPPA